MLEILESKSCRMTLKDLAFIFHQHDSFLSPTKGSPRAEFRCVRRIIDLCWFMLIICSLSSNRRFAFYRLELQSGIIRETVMCVVVAQESSTLD